jgi:hypothetical protein
MSNTTVNLVLDRLSAVFSATEEILNDWSSETNLQFPTLLSMMAAKFNWNEKQLKEADPVIRYYIRNNPNWYITRGAHGGIMRSSDRQKKQDALLAKETLKKQMKAKIEAATQSASGTEPDDDTLGE